MIDQIIPASALALISCGAAAIGIKLHRHRADAFVALFLLISSTFVGLGYALLSFREVQVDAPRALTVSAIGIASASVFALTLGRARIAGDFGASFRLDRLPAMAGVVVSIGLAASYFFFVGQVPLFTAVGALAGSESLDGGLNTVRISRDSYVTGADPIPLQGLLESVRYFGVPWAGLLAFQLRRQRKLGSLMWLLLAAASLILIVSSGQRWPLMYAIAALLIFERLKSARQVGAPPKRQHPSADDGFNGRLSTRRPLAAGLAAGVFLTMLLGRQSTDGGVLGLPKAVAQLLDRAVTGYVATPILSFGEFTESTPLLFGQTYLQNLYAFVPGPGESYAVTFYRAVTGDQVGFTAPPDLFLEAWLNFGWVGVAVLPPVWIWFGHRMWSRAHRATRVEGMAFWAVVGSAFAFSPISGPVFVLGAVVGIAPGYIVAFLVRRSARTSGGSSALASSHSMRSYLAR